MRIGFVQTLGIGDIIIALPIATAFAERGDTVFWPIDAAWVPSFSRAAPWIEFLPVASELRTANPEEYFLRAPQRELRERECDTTHLLYSSLNIAGATLENERFSAFFKFDEYKYAISGIPFDEKWNLKINRDLERESRFFESLGISRPFICMHDTSSEVAVKLGYPPEWDRDFEIIRITERSDSPFDWIYTMERAAKIICVDSCFSNLVEQLNLPNEKYLVLRTPGPFTPVMKNGWRFI